MGRIALTHNLIPLPPIVTQVAFTSVRTIMGVADTGIFEALGMRRVRPNTMSQCSRPYVSGNTVYAPM